MVTQLFGSVVYDCLRVTKAAEFFDAKTSVRKEEVKKMLGAEYPVSIVSYLETVGPDQYVTDAEMAMHVLAGSTSIIEQARRLAEANGLFSAFLDMLPEVRGYTGSRTSLGETLGSFREAGGSYARVFDRELQTLLLHARGEDSPILQVAAEVELSKVDLPGIPSVTVRKDLIGGVRMFYDGSLTDDSWRARLTKVLSAVS